MNLRPSPTYLGFEIHFQVTAPNEIPKKRRNDDIVYHRVDNKAENKKESSSHSRTTRIPNDVRNSLERFIQNDRLQENGKEERRQFPAEEPRHDGLLAHGCRSPAGNMDA